MMSDLYHSVIVVALDEHAPIITRSVPSSHTSPWFNVELRAMKAKGRQLERLLEKLVLLSIFKHFWNILDIIILP